MADSPFVKGLKGVALGNVLGPGLEALSFDPAAFALTPDPTGSYDEPGGRHFDGALQVGLAPALALGGGSQWARNVRYQNGTTILAASGGGGPDVNIMVKYLARNDTGADVTISEAKLYNNGASVFGSNTDFWALKLGIADATGAVTTSGAKTLTTKTTGGGGTDTWAFPGVYTFTGGAFVIPDGHLLALEFFVTGTPAADLGPGPTFDILFK